MKAWVAIGMLALSSTQSLTTATATVLRNREKFFSQIAAGALQGAVGALAPQPGAMNPAMAAVTPTEEKPVIPAIDSERTGKLESMQKLLDRKIQQAQELKTKLEDELQFMKAEGLLEAGKGAAALQGAQAVAGQQGAIGGMLPDLAAPIIFLEPPPVTKSQTLEAGEVAETTLAQIGDYSSPAMKAVREYELKRLGQIAGTTLEIRKEIRETESAIEKRKKERDALTDKLKADGRALAKEGNRHLEMQAAFANADLKEKAKELDILADKLTQLKTRERDLIKRQGPGTEEKEELEKEEEEASELEAEMEEED